MATNQNEYFSHNFTTQQKFPENFCQNTCSETEINVNFHFSHYKSM